MEGRDKRTTNLALHRHAFLRPDVFGAFLLYTAWKIAHHDGTTEVDYNENIAMRIVRRVVPTTHQYEGHKLFTRNNGKRLATPLFAVLVLIEATDVVFAVDSVPAILAVVGASRSSTAATVSDVIRPSKRPRASWRAASVSADPLSATSTSSRGPFIVFAANAFAILGLRSLYFLLGGMQGKFRYLNVGLGVILAFVGIKMLLIRRTLRSPPSHLRVARLHRPRHHRRRRSIAARRRSRPSRQAKRSYRHPRQ